MNREETVRALAPPAPPCFSSRDQWLEYLAEAAKHQRPGHNGPLLIVQGHTPVFNPKFSFCADCSAIRMQAMQKKGRCDPEYLIKLLPAVTQPMERRAVERSTEDEQA